MVSDEAPARIESTLALATVLAAVTGFVDAHVYLHVARVFVANQSGNVVLFGIAVGEGRWATVVAHIVAITMFAVGVALGTTVHHRRTASGRELRPDLVLLVETAMLLVMLVLLAAFDPEPDARPGVLDDVVLAIGALAMGLQTVVIGRVGSVAVATTYESGAVARVGEETAIAARGARTGDERGRHLFAVKVLVAVIACYAAGAALAAAAGEAPVWLLGPVVVALACSFPIRRLADRASRQVRGDD